MLSSALKHRWQKEMSRLVTQLTTRHQTPATHLEAVRERDPEPPLPITPPSQGSPSDRGGQPHRLQKWEFIIARCREKLGYVWGNRVTTALMCGNTSIALP